MPTKSAGRVSIRVLPDSSRFREDLKLSLERIERAMKVTIPAHLEVTRESVRRLKEQLEGLEVRVKIEPYVTEEQLHELKRKIENVNPHLNANLDAANAQRRLAFISRDRNVTLFVRVNQASARAALATLAALSGQRLVANIFTDFFDRIKNLDKHAPRIAIVTTAITLLSASVLALISNIGGLLGSFAQLGQISVLLPAMLTGAAINIGVLIAALKDMKKVLADLAPEFHELQDVISKNFWNEAAQPIRNLVENLFPTLKKTLGELSTAWGGLFGDMAREIQKNVTPEQLTFMMGNLTSSVQILRGAMAPTIRAFNTLGRFGSQYLPRLSTWMVKLSTDFDAFIQRADQDGSLERWAETGIKAFKDFGRVLYQTGRVFSALNMAAKRAGGADFEKLAGGLERLSNTMRRENFQKTFETIFSGAHAAMEGFFQMLDEIGGGLKVLAPTLSIAFAEVAKILEGIGTLIKLVFSDLTFQTGITDFFSGFKTFITDLKPAMGPIAQIFGTIFTALGSFLAQSGPVLAILAQQMAPLFTELWKVIQPLLPDLFALTETLIEELGPILLTFVKEVLPPLIPLIKELAPLLGELVKATSPVIIAFFEELGRALDKSTPSMASGVKELTGLVDVLNKWPKAGFQFMSGDDKGGFSTLLQMAIDHPEIVTFFSALDVALGGLTEKLLGSANTIEIINGMTQGMTLMGNAGTIAAIGLQTFFGIQLLWDKFWGDLKLAWDQFWRGLPEPIYSASVLVPAAINWLFTGGLIAFGVGYMQISTGWTMFWQGMLISLGVWLSQIAQGISAGIPAMVTAIVMGVARFGPAFALGWSVILAAIPLWFEKITLGIGMGISLVLRTVGKLPADMATEIGKGFTTMFRAGGALIKGFAEGITGGSSWVTKALSGVLAAASLLLPKSPAKKGPLSGKGWTLYSGRATVEGFAQGMRERTAMLQNQARNTMSVAALKAGTSSFASAASDVTGYEAGERGALVHIGGDYYGATPEKVADEFDKKIRRANVAAQISKVRVGK